MNKTSQSEIKEELARQHDNILSALMLNRTERRKRKVRATKKELERLLFATGLVISQTDKL